uniref:ADP-ribosylation factor-like protein 6 n=1 Tax=Lygus hesperus TaxID=30085 RepID=A0A0A9XH92_LYGHE
MGNSVDSICGPVCYTRVKLVLIGLDSAGKTAILNRFTAKPQCQAPYQPTVGANHQMFTWSRLRVSAWDFGGSPHSRPIWKKYYSSVDVVVFVVDCSDYKRFDEARCEFRKAVTDKKLSRNALVLVYANKQDLPGAVLPCQVEVRFGMNSLKKGTWKIQPSSAHTCEGLFEGLAWIKRTIKGNNASKVKTESDEVKCHDEDGQERSDPH